MNHELSFGKKAEMRGNTRWYRNDNIKSIKTALFLQL